MDQYAGALYRVAFSVLRNPADAEDAVQEAFLRVLRHRDSLGEVRDHRVWLIRIVWNIVLDRKRRAKTRPETDDVAELARVLPSNGLSAEEMAAAAQHHAHVLACVDQLPAKERQVLLLSAFEELSSVEIAAVLDITESSVRSRLFRARNLMAGLLDHARNCDEFEPSQPDSSASLSRIWRRNIAADRRPCRRRRDLKIACMRHLRAARGTRIPSARDRSGDWGGRRRGRVLAWPAALKPQSSWMRTAAAAAIVFVVAGGGWGVYTRVEQNQPARVIRDAAAHVGASGGFSGAGAMRTPETLTGPTVNAAAQPAVAAAAQTAAPAQPERVSKSAKCAAPQSRGEGAARSVRGNSAPQ